LTIFGTIKAPRDRVFEAWADHAQLHKWSGAGENFTVPIVEVDLRMGGSYRLGMRAPGQDAPYVVGGVYREVSSPKKLVYSWL